jgi:hypothetical protein
MFKADNEVWPPFGRNPGVEAFGTGRIFPIAVSLVV